MRTLSLLALLAGLTVTAGCSSSNYDRWGRSYPASARVDERGGQDRYAVCHKGRNTLTLPQPSVRAHLNHGDEFGPCARGRNDHRARGDRNDRRDREDRRNRRDRNDRYERDDDRRDDRGRGRGNGRGNGRGHLDG